MEFNFYNQWSNRPTVAAQEFKLPTCTVPDQYMTIAQIIARFTRAGVVPKGATAQQAGRIISQAYPQQPDGQAAYDPDFDPLDQYTDEMEAVKAARGSEQAPQESGSEPEPTSAPAGEGGE